PALGGMLRKMCGQLDRTKLVLDQPLILYRLDCSVRQHEGAPLATLEQAYDLLARANGRIRLLVALFDQVARRYVERAERMVRSSSSSIPFSFGRETINGESRSNLRHYLFVGRCDTRGGQDERP